MKRTVISSALVLALFFSVALWGKEFRFTNNNSVAPAAAGKHLRARSPGARVGAHQVDRDCLREPLRRLLGQRSEQDDARIVDEYIWNGAE